tara:strand:- start:13738 stop:13944 length:207 start_codon:yes stop_codon:yes gene_type:complete
MGKPKFLLKVTYPDQTEEYWHDPMCVIIPDLARLQKIHNNKLVLQWLDIRQTGMNLGHIVDSPEPREV